jgi:dihydroorotate dehydrogenase/NAD-dependent dihydropyrimidine dehydrogenase PreA subunit
MAEAGVGGIVTKTMTNLETPRTRPRPHSFALHGKGFDQSGCLLTLVGNWPEPIDTVLEKRMPAFKRMCLEAGVPLVVSWYGPMEMENGRLKPGVIESWKRTAQKVEAAGADLQELNISCPHVSQTLRKEPSIGFELIRAICGAGFKAGVKVQISWEPLEELAKGWAAAGALFITAHNVDTVGLVVDIEKESPKFTPSMGGYILGRSMLPWSLSRVVRIKQNVDTPVFALGGAYTSEDAIQYLLCGASVVQMHTAVYFRGPGIFKKVIRGIEDWMKKKGYQKIEDFRGKVLPMVLSWPEIKSRAKHPFVVPPDCPYAPVIDSDRCNLCGMCEQCCPFRVYRSEGEIMRVEETRCDSCGFCLTICPKQAITLVEKGDKSKIVWDPKVEIMAKPYQDLLDQLGRRKR